MAETVRLYSPAAAQVIGPCSSRAAPPLRKSVSTGFHPKRRSTISLQMTSVQPLTFFMEPLHSELRRSVTCTGGARVMQIRLQTYSCRASLGSAVAAQRPYTAVMIVPTGTGASIGGFAGDSLPVARAMASVADRVITHPNVLNGAMLYWPMPNVLYVEGYALDKFAEGSWGLQPVHQNRVGLVLDAGMEEELRLRHLQVADAACATLGLPLLEYTTTDMPLQVEKWVDACGASTGRLGRPDSLMRAVNSLVKHGRVDAVAVVARFPDDSCEDLIDYRQGQGVDVLAGVEAIISHMVVREFQIPCAHAPALSLLPFDQTVSPRSAAEEIGFTFLPCVLVGLSRAPQYISKMEHQRGVANSTLWASDVDCVVVPINACGGAGTLAFARQTGRKPLVLAVEENETVLDDTPEKLHLDVIRVANYWEALGVMAAHKAGVDPRALRRNGVTHLRSYNFSTVEDVIHISDQAESALLPAQKILHG